jgi:hypothetical protein
VLRDGKSVMWPGVQAAAEAMAGEPRYEVVPAGWAESPLKDQAQAPRQGNLGAPPAWLAFEPEATEGIPRSSGRY